MENQEIWVLSGHRIPNKVEALSVFIGKPTKEQLLKTWSFRSGGDLESKLIDILLKHGVAGTKQESIDFRFEYVLSTADGDGNLNLHDKLLTGVTDMNESLCIDLDKY